jgi:hypothetical protein
MGGWDAETNSGGGGSRANESAGLVGGAGLARRDGRARAAGRADGAVAAWEEGRALRAGDSVRP